MYKVQYTPPPENLDGLNPIQRFMQRKSTLQDYFYLGLFVLAYIAARPTIKKGAEWLLASPEYKEGMQKQKEFEQRMAKAKIGANAIRGQKEDKSKLLLDDGNSKEIDEDEAEATGLDLDESATNQVQNRKNKSKNNKSEIDKLIDWDDEPARTKQKGDTSDVVAWLDKWSDEAEN